MQFDLETLAPSPLSSVSVISAVTAKRNALRGAVSMSIGWFRWLDQSRGHASLLD